MASITPLFLSILANKKWRAVYTKNLESCEVPLRERSMAWPIFNHSVPTAGPQKPRNYWQQLAEGRDPLKSGQYSFHHFLHTSFIVTQVNYKSHTFTCVTFTLCVLQFHQEPTGPETIWNIPCPVILQVFAHAVCLACDTSLSLSLSLSPCPHLLLLPLYVSLSLSANSCLLVKTQFSYSSLWGQIP